MTIHKSSPTPLFEDGQSRVVPQGCATDPGDKGQSCLSHRPVEEMVKDEHGRHREEDQQGPSQVPTQDIL
jgi:hypothetical protein